MRTPIAVARAASLILLLAAGAASCSAGKDPQPLGCASTRDCPFLEICHVPQGLCVPEPKDAVMGSISCEVMEPSNVEKKMGYTDVIADMQGIRYNLTGFSQCILTATDYGVNVLALYATQMQLDGREWVTTLLIDTARISPGQPYALIDNNMTIPQETIGSGALMRGQDEVVGVYGGGYVIFDSVPQVGGTVNIFLEAPLRPVGATVTGCDDGRTGHSDCSQCLTVAQAEAGCCAQHKDLCVGNPDCNALIGCSNTCTTDACFDTCMNEHVAGLTGFVSLQNCLFGSTKLGTLGACGSICQ